jgi:hypothetical protein
MKKQIIVGGLIVAAQISGSAGAFAVPWEDGMAAYNCGDDGFKTATGSAARRPARP